jgi:GNAT superfamily N-acetyltransferase
MANALETPPPPIPRLVAVEFTATSAPLSGFSCGIEEWHLELNEWICTQKVLDSITQRGTKVWVYYLNNDIVGYGSLGVTERPPPPPGKNRRFSIIPYLAVQTTYHGQPYGALRDDKFAGQIMNDLILKARQLGHPQLILYVHPKNDQAKAFYDKFGFSNEGLVRGGHELMGLRLS